MPGKWLRRGFGPELEQKMQRLVALLRRTDALDKSHRYALRKVKLTKSGGARHLNLEARKPIAEELVAITTKSDHWKRLAQTELMLILN